MQRQRDERGRFVRGNTVAVGNKGNRHSKYGNENAKSTECTLNCYLLKK